MCTSKSKSYVRSTSNECKTIVTRTILDGTPVRPRYGWLDKIPQILWRSSQAKDSIQPHHQERTEYTNSDSYFYNSKLYRLSCMTDSLSGVSVEQALTENTSSIAKVSDSPYIALGVYVGQALTMNQPLTCSLTLHT